MEVRKITRKECEPFILNVHYAKRWPSISYAYGLFKKTNDDIFPDSEELIGIVTYGTPSSAPLRRGLAGDSYKEQIIELNRLCLKYNKKNEASFLISKSLKMLPRNKIIISYADSSQNHVGYIYQATNFLYCGLSAKRTDWAIKGKEHLHGQTIADKFRGVNNRSKAIREKYGDDFYLKPRPRKHRYIYIIGSKKYKKKVLKSLKYPIEPYPK